MRAADRAGLRHGHSEAGVLRGQRSALARTGSTSKSWQPLISVRVGELSHLEVALWAISRAYPSATPAAAFSNAQCPGVEAQLVGEHLQERHRAPRSAGSIGLPHFHIKRVDKPIDGEQAGERGRSRPRRRRQPDVQQAIGGTSPRSHRRDDVELGLEQLQMCANRSCRTRPSSRRQPPDVQELPVERHARYEAIDIDQPIEAPKPLQQVLQLEALPTVRLPTVWQRSRAEVG